MRPTAEQRRIVKRMELRARLTGAARQALWWWIGINAILIGCSAIWGDGLPHGQKLWCMALTYPIFVLILAKDRVQPSRRKRGDRV